jgi:SAM-dependent methyltransferase
MTRWLGNELPAELEKRLICTDCRRVLHTGIEGYYCIKCSRKFPVRGGIPVFWDSKDSFKAEEARFYGNEAKNPSLASLERNFYRYTHYDKKKNEIPFKHLRPNSLILSLGGGDGRHGLDLLKRGHQVLESDLAPDSAAVAGSKFRNSRHEGKWAVAAIDAEDIPFMDATFDAVYLCAALHQMPNQLAVANGIRRVLKPGGKLILAAEPASWFYKVIRPLAQVMGIRSGQLGVQSVGDEANKGLSHSALSEFVDKSGGRIIVFSGKYYLTGFLYQATEAAYRLLRGKLRDNMSIRQWEVEFCTIMDSVMENLPVISKYPFFWTVIAEKK